MDRVNINLEKYIYIYICVCVYNYAIIFGLIVPVGRDYMSLHVLSSVAIYTRKRFLRSEILKELRWRFIVVNFLRDINIKVANNYIV